MSTTLYDASSDRQFNPFAGVFTLTLGIALLAWYLHGIVEAVEGDIHNFPAAFHESPVLTLIFVVLKPIGYVSFGALFILMIYGPMRNLFLKRVVSGKLRSMSVEAKGKGKLLLSVEIGAHHLVLPDRGGLGDVICDEALLGQELRFTLGAFNRVHKVEKGP
ncbi:MAG: hypothetical protein ACHQLQ_12150 [Candidatus Acidiferrales bacterium]